MKKNLGCSPDDADAMAIAYGQVGRFSFSFGTDDVVETTTQEDIEAMRELVNKGEKSVPISKEAIDRVFLFRPDLTADKPAHQNWHQRH